MSYARNRWAAYGRVHKELIYDTAMSSTAVRVAAMLDDLAGSSADFTQADLAARLACSVDTIRRAIQELEGGGWLMVERRKGESNKQLPSVYELRHPGSKNATRESPEPPSKNATRVEAVPGSKNATPLPSKNAASREEPGSKSATPITLTKPPSKNATLNKERDDTRDKETGAPAAQMQTLELASMPSPAPAKPKSRPRDPLFDAVVDVFRIDLSKLTKSSGLGKVVSELRSVGATPEQVAGVYRAMVRKYGPDKVTPFAMAKHWHEFVSEPETPRQQYHYTADVPIRQVAL